MIGSQIFFPRQIKHLFTGILFLFTVAIYAAFNDASESNYDIKKREILLRRIGHELLLHSGDSVSRVLPLIKISKYEYQIQFEKDFSFKPDSLIAITKRYLKKETQWKSYIVNVLNCKDKSVVYGYILSKNEKDELISCRGRIQPKGCYLVAIRFKSAEFKGSYSYYIFGSAVILIVIIVVIYKLKRNKKFPEIRHDNVFTLGLLVFDVNHKKLLINEETINLTATETRVLAIFAKSPNKIIERNRLQKEIWEDEGVIVGRSLDMFVSKLRKKLEVDPNVKIVVVRGRGYRLEISS